MKTRPNKAVPRLFVAHALLRAAPGLVSALGPGIDRSVDAAGRSVCATLAILFFAMCAPAQPPATNRAAPKPRPARPAPTAAARPAPASVKDLNFPPLKPVRIPDIATLTLPNGMKLYLLEDHELPVISGRALVRTGNLFDPPEKVGLATLTGQVMRTGGGKSKSGDQWNEELENMAASVESSIGETSGAVSFSALKENVDPVLAIFKEVLTAPEFRQDQIDLVKMRVRSGISRRNDDPQGLAEREFNEIVYGKNTPYGWREEYATIDRISRADLQAFHERYFFPKNIMLAVWGDFDAAAMRSKLEQLFGGWTADQPPVPPFPKVRETPDPGIYLAAKKDVTQTFFFVGQQGGEIRDKDYPALEVMADILGGGFQSRLFRRVRSKMGDAYDIGAQWDANYDHPGLFQVSGSTKSVSTVETIQAIQEEVERIRSTEVSEDELKSAKDTALNSFVFAFDTTTKTLGRMLTYEYFGYPKDFIQQYRTALAAVTRAEVLRVAKAHLNPAKFTVVAVGNPAAFTRPLAALGPVHEIDLTIPQPETAPADPASLAKGKQMLGRAQQAVGGADKLAAIRDFTQTMDVRVDPSGESARLVIDPATGMPRSLRYQTVHAAGAPASMEDVWSDFRDVDGLKLPFKTSIMSNDRKFADVLITECKINSGLKPEELQQKP
jgi:zinc protease